MENLTKRKSNFEWLRILAMGMIITLHYMFKGGVIQSPSADNCASNYAAWLLTAMSVCAVNVYVLISGYFLTETTFKMRRLVGLVVQVLEYSLAITLVMLITGQVSLSELTIYDWIGYVFPIGTEEYWFITAYLMMFLMAPLLAAGVKAIDKKQFQIILHVLLIFTVLEKTVLPMVLPTDNAGYDFVWFMILFMLAAYIRIYGMSFLEGHTARAWAVYGISVLLICTVGIFGNILGASTGIETFTHYGDIVWDYNFFFTLTAAIGLFYVFKNARFNEEARTADIARAIGSLTLGVYLLHEHPLIRYRWQSLLGARSGRTVIGMLANWIMCVAVIYAAGLAVEFLRRQLHGLVTRRIASDKK